MLKNNKYGNKIYAIIGIRSN